MDPIPHQQELQRKLIALESAKRQLEAIAKQMQMVEATRAEIVSTKEALKAMDDMAEGTPILVPLGSGSFLRATLADKKHILYGIGSALSIERTIADASSSLSKREEELQKVLSTISAKGSELQQHIAALNQELQTAMPRQ